MTVSRHTIAAILMGCVAASAVACGGDDDARPLRLEIHGPDSQGPFPVAIDPDVIDLRVRVMQGNSFVDGDTASYNDFRVRLAELSFGANYWYIVEGLDVDGEVIASGASARFTYNETTRISPTVFTMEPNAVRPAFAYFEQEETSDVSLLEDGRAGHTATHLDGDRGVLIVGGANIGPAASGPANSGFLSTRDVVELYDPYSGLFHPLCDADLLDDASAGCDIDTCLDDSFCWLELETARAFHTATLMNDGSVIVTGGLELLGTTQVLAVNNVEIITVDSNRISARMQVLDPVDEALFIPRAFHTATVSPEGDLIVIGGMTGDFAAPTFPAEVEIFIPSEGYFIEPPTALAVPRALHTATEVNGHIVVAGGRTLDALTAASELIEFDPSSSNPFLGEPPSVNSGQGRFGHTASPVLIPGLDGDYVAIAGGYTEVGGTLLAGTTATANVEFYSGDLYAYDPDQTTMMATARAFHAATRLRVLPELAVVGGEDGALIQGDALVERLAFEAVPGVFIPTANIGATPRSHAAAVGLGSDFVLTVGGTNGTSSQDDALFFNPNDYQFLPGGG